MNAPFQAFETLASFYVRWFALIGSVMLVAQAILPDFHVCSETNSEPRFRWWGGHQREQRI